MVFFALQHWAENSHQYMSLFFFCSGPKPSKRIPWSFHTKTLADSPFLWSEMHRRHPEKLWAPGKCFKSLQALVSTSVRKKGGGITLALFSSNDQVGCPRRSSFCNILSTYYMLGILLETTVSKINTISSLMGPLVNINFFILIFLIPKTFCIGV